MTTLTTAQQLRDTWPVLTGAGTITSGQRALIHRAARELDLLRNMLIEERKRYKLAMDNAYPDVGMGLMPMVAQAEAEKEIDAEIATALGY